jgi:hypothetical protein
VNSQPTEPPQDIYPQTVDMGNAMWLDTGMNNGYNIQKRSFDGHKPWVVIYCWNNATQAKIVYSANSKSGCTRWVNQQRSAA